MSRATCIDLLKSDHTRVDLEKVDHPKWIGVDQSSSGQRDMRSTGLVDQIHPEQPDSGKIFSRCSLLSVYRIVEIVDVYVSIWQILMQANNIWSICSVSPSRLINFFVNKEAYLCFIAFGVEQIK